MSGGVWFMIVSGGTRDEIDKITVTNLRVESFNGRCDNRWFPACRH